MVNEPEMFRLTKRFRHQEEYNHINAEVPWTKQILDVEGGTILGRTPLRWLLLIIFYTIFFASIVLLWYFCYWVFEKTLTEPSPKWSLAQPGFSFEPSITITAKYVNIEYYEHLEDEVDLYVDRIIASLRKYGNVTDNYFGACQQHNEYGYKNRHPCFFLKINRIIGFKTQPIESVNELAPEAPDELRKYLQELSEDKLKNRLWVSCESKPSFQIEYFPSRFYSSSDVDITKAILHDAPIEYKTEFGPENSRFYDQNDFKRIIAVQIQNVTVNVKHWISCYLWAKNIKHDLQGRGLVRFSFEVKL